MDLFTLSASLTLDTASYEKAVAQAKQQSQTLGSQLQALGEKNAAAARKVQELSSALNASTVKTGAASKESQELAAKLQKAQKEASDAAKEFKDCATALDKMNESGNSVGSSVNGFSSKLTKSITVANLVSNALSKLASKAVEVGVSFVQSGVEYNAKIEQYQIALTTLLGSAEEADAAIKAIQEDAAKTPFDTDGLIAANRYLIATGESAEDARKVINALGDAVSAVGGSNDELQRMAQNLQQIKNAGAATAADIKQFAYAGIDIYGLLADYLEKDVEQVKTADATYENLANAMIKAAQEGGKFYGAMEAQSETFNGKVDTLKDNWEQLLGKITEGINESAKPAVEDLNTAVTNLYENTDWDAWSNSLQGIFNSIVSGAETAITWINKIISAYNTLNAAYTSSPLTSFSPTSVGAGVGKTIRNVVSSAVTGTNDDDVRNNKTWLQAQAKNGNTQAAERLKTIEANEAAKTNAKKLQTQTEISKTGTSLTYTPASTSLRSSNSAISKLGQSTTSTYISSGGGSGSNSSGSSTKKSSSTKTKEKTDAEKLAEAVKALGDAYVYEGTEEQAHEQRLAVLQSTYEDAQTKVQQYTGALQGYLASGDKDMAQYTLQQLESAEKEVDSAKQAIEDYEQELAGGTAAEQAAASLKALGDAYTFTGDESELAATKLAYYENEVTTAQTKVDKLKQLFLESAQATGYDSEITQEYVSELEKAESELDSAKEALEDYKDETDEAKKATEELKDSVSDLSGSLGGIGSAISKLGEAFGLSGVSELGDFVSGLGDGIDTVVSFSENIQTLTSSLQKLSTVIKTVKSSGSSLSSVLKVLLGSTTTTATTTAATTSVTTGGVTGLLSLIGGSGSTGIFSSLASAATSAASALGPVGLVLAATGLISAFKVASAEGETFAEKIKNAWKSSTLGQTVSSVTNPNLTFGQKAADVFLNYTPIGWIAKLFGVKTNQQKYEEELAAQEAAAQEAAAQEAAQQAAYTASTSKTTGTHNYSDTRPAGITIENVKLDDVETTASQLLSNSIKSKSESKSESKKTTGTEINITINGAQYSSEESLAKVVSRQLQALSNREVAVFA